MLDDRAVTDDALSGRCGRCAHFQAPRFDPNRGVVVGECKGGQYPPVRPETSSCSLFVQQGTLAARLHKPARSQPRHAPEAPVSRPPIDIEVDMDEATFRKVLREVLQEELSLSDPAITDRFRGGELVLKPSKAGAQEKKVPIEVFFRKVVAVRDKLRVLEQKINSTRSMSDEERATLQQYITGCYGSLTTFNILFKDTDDHFVGQGGDP